MSGKYAHVVHLIIVLNAVCLILSNVYSYTTTRGWYIRLYYVYWNYVVFHGQAF
jgi:hypothetical protein